MKKQITQSNYLSIFNTNDGSCNYSKIHLNEQRMNTKQSKIYQSNWSLSQQLCAWTRMQKKHQNLSNIFTSGLTCKWWMRTQPLLKIDKNRQNQPPNMNESSESCLNRSSKHLRTLNSPHLQTLTIPITITGQIFSS